LRSPFCQAEPVHWTGALKGPLPHWSGVADGLESVKVVVAVCPV